MPSTSTTTSSAARDERVMMHLHLAKAIARRIRSGPIGKGVELEDLVAYGVIGLLEAASRFDASRGVPFAGFAGRRIHGAIVDGIRLHHWFGRDADRRLRIERVGEDWLVEPADADHACNDTRWNGRPMIQPPVEPDDARHKVVVATLRRLPVRQRRLLDLRYNQGRTLRAAAEEMGFGSSWASRLHDRALAALRAADKKHTSLPHRPVGRDPNEKHPGDFVPTDRRVVARRNGPP